MLLECTASALLLAPGSNAAPFEGDKAELIVHNTPERACATLDPYLGLHDGDEAKQPRENMRIDPLAEILDGVLPLLFDPPSPDLPSCPLGRRFGSSPRQLLPVRSAPAGRL